MLNIKKLSSLFTLHIHISSKTPVCTSTISQPWQRSSDLIKAQLIIMSHLRMYRETVCVYGCELGALDDSMRHDPHQSSRLSFIYIVNMSLCSLLHPRKADHSRLQPWSRNKRSSACTSHDPDQHYQLNHTARRTQLSCMLHSNKAYLCSNLLSG